MLDALIVLPRAGKRPHILPCGPTVHGQSRRLAEFVDRHVHGEVAGPPLGVETDLKRVERDDQVVAVPAGNLRGNGKVDRRTIAALVVDDKIADRAQILPV